MMPMAGLVLVLALGLFGAAVAVLVLWAFAVRWPWPEALPSPGLDLWVRGGWLAPAWTTTSLGLASAGLSLLLAVAVLETEDRSRHRLGLGPVLLLPLPQIGFLPGLTSAFLRLRLPPGWVAVLWAQSLFVFPSVLIALAGPWRALSPEMLRSAASLGAGPWRCLFAIRLLLLLRPMALAAAVGFAVSAAQYLAVPLPAAAGSGTGHLPDPRLRR